MVDLEERTEVIVEHKNKKNTLYITARDQRIHENHCIILGYEISEKLKKKFYIGCELERLKLNPRQKNFVVQGLKKLEADSKKYNLNFSLIENNKLKKFCDEKEIDCIIIDYNPMREYLKRSEELKNFCKTQKMKLIRVDAHNMVPCQSIEIYKRTSSSVKLQLNKKWNQFFSAYPKLRKHKYNVLEDIENVYPEVDGPLYKYEGGYDTGMDMYEKFCKEKFSIFSDQRNNTEKSVNSNLSPWLIFGQISPQQIIYLIHERFVGKDNENLESYLNELFIWRETADHFVFHEPNYDNIDGALLWAKETLLTHIKDPRDLKFSPKDLELGLTDDLLWNSAQKEMVQTGKMHGYARMYWCKTLLKWFKDPRDALKFAIEQNDSYSVDGNSSAGYLGCMWSICGSMDRAFKEREIFGKIRPMKAFKSPQYIKKYNTVAKK